MTTMEEAVKQRDGEERRSDKRRLYVRLAQLHKAIWNNLSEKCIARIINREIDVNFRIPDDFFHEIGKSELNSSSILHLAVRGNNEKAFDYLLAEGADYTVKNAAGSTALHEAMEKYFNEAFDYDQWENSYVKSILEAHVKDGNFTNPRDEHGLSHFHVACLANNVQATELFLKNGVSANVAVDADSPVFPGYTPLHFAARCASADATELLLRYGANCTIKDANGVTILQMVVRKQLKFIDQRNTEEEDNNDDEFRRRFDNNERMLKLLLNINETDASDDVIGLSAFHAACTLRDTSMVEHLLMKVSDIDHRVKTDSPLWPGNTALHFAALANVNTVKLLLKSGANLEAKNAEDVSPFDTCLAIYHINDISHLISCHPIWKDIRFSDGDVKLTDFINGLYNTSKLINKARNFLITAHSSLPLDSPLWPGSTPLHLAVIFFERRKARFHTKHEDDDDDDNDDYDHDDGRRTNKVIKLFFNTEYFKPIPNVLAQDAYGRTPIHVAFKMRKHDILRFLVERNDKIQNPIDIDNLSLLHIACLINEEHLVEELLFIGEDANVPVLTDLKFHDDSTVSAGSTPLHSAVLHQDRQAMTKLLGSGADPFAQDVNGISPIHRLIATECISYCRIFTDTSDLSNVAPVTGGVTYLHIACIADDRAAVEKLIARGADVNAIIAFDTSSTDGLYSKELVKLLTPYVGSSPLHLALQYNSLNAVELLIANGADLFAKTSSDKPSVISNILQKNYLKNVNILLLHLRFKDDMRENLKNKTGLTVLHVACNALDVTTVRYLLDKADDEQVNARAHADSPVWPGCTALHVLLENLEDRLKQYGRTRNRYVDNFHVILKLLMDNGADVTLTNTDGQTPVDISRKLYRRHIRAKTWLCTTLPMNSNHGYYDLNFIDDSGISLFQEACHENNVTVVEEFLKRGVDVNQRVDAFADDFAGYTPLHFVAKQRWPCLIGSSQQLATMEILLNHGADVHARDVNDNTPLHIVVQRGSSREKLITILMEFGADVDAVNVYGETPLEVLLKSIVSAEELTIFLKKGVRINSYNCITGMGFIPMLFDSYESDFDAVIEALIHNATDVNETDDEGRTVIHNIVSSSNGNVAQGELAELYIRFIEHGCDIDQQDKSGRTALHTAVQWYNDLAISQLLELNADASIVDENGKTAVDYMVGICTCGGSCSIAMHGYIKQALSLQPIKLEMTGFQEFAKYRDLEKICHDDDDRKQDYRKSLKKAKKTYIIPGELSLFDFASETGAVGNYLHMMILKRDIVDDFFKSMNAERYVRIGWWLKNHYRKALMRSALVESAKQSLNSLIGFSLPHICSDSIVRFLSNNELKKLIAASTTVNADKT